MKLTKAFLLRENTDKLTFTTSSVSDFQNSFTLTLMKNNQKIGVFKYYYDSDELTSHNSADIFNPYRNQGYGKILLLLAIRTANDNDLGYTEDKSLTADQRRVYDSLLKNDLIDGAIGSYKLTPKGEDYLESLGL